jgi:DnaJ-class molecular chaperone
MYNRPAPPKVADYYLDLGVSPTASGVDIKNAFHKLALEHHPEKKSPGVKIDAVQFRKASRW